MSEPNASVSAVGQSILSLFNRWRRAATMSTYTKHFLLYIPRDGEANDHEFGNLLVWQQIAVQLPT